MADEFSKEEIYNIWAPADALWSRWVKPVLFACMEMERDPYVEARPPCDASWAPPADQKIALVLDLPREEGVTMGLELAQRDYRPVPLYNAIPKPTVGVFTQLGFVDYALPIVDVEPIQTALRIGAAALAQISLPPDAPPVFLLDSNRRHGDYAATPGRFDNRSVSFTTDFPSALFLQTHGIRRTIFMPAFGFQPQADLAHTLRRWQESGIAIELKRRNSEDPPQPCQINKPSWFGAMWYRVGEAFGLKRNVLGGYGGVIGQSSGG